jgi:hypothetical protein
MKVYKYRFFNDNTKSILKTEEFFFANWEDMNDPMEGFFEYYDEEHTSDIIQALKDAKNNYGICCFSKESNNILLWSHYADNHKGICIEIDIDDNICANQEITFEDLKYKSNIPNLIESSNQTDKAKWLLSRKTILWNYEKEIRAFCKGSKALHKIGTISKVFIGLRCSEEIKNELKSLCNTNNYTYQEVELDFDNNLIKERKDNNEVS